MASVDGDGSDLAEARELFDTFQWRRCVDQLAAADAQQPLDGDGLLLLGRAAHLIGADEQSVAAYARAYQLFLEAGDVRSAVRSAMAGALVLENATEPVRSRAWAARAEKLVEEHDLGGGEAAWVLSYRAHDQLAAGRVPTPCSPRGTASGWGSRPATPTPSSCAV